MQRIFRTCRRSSWTRPALRRAVLLNLCPYLRRFGIVFRRFAAPVYLGPPLLNYPEITAEERESALVFSEELRKKLGPLEPKLREKILTVRPSTLSIDKQKEELRKRGYLQ